MKMEPYFLKLASNLDRIWDPARRTNRHISKAGKEQTKKNHFILNEWISTYKVKILFSRVCVIRLKWFEKHKLYLEQSFINEWEWIEHKILFSFRIRIEFFCIYLANLNRICRAGSCHEGSIVYLCIYWNQNMIKRQLWLWEKRKKNIHVIDENIYYSILVLY